MYLFATKTQVDHSDLDQLLGDGEVEGVWME